MRMRTREKKEKTATKEIKDLFEYTVDELISNFQNNHLATTRTKVRATIAR